MGLGFKNHLLLPKLRLRDLCMDCLKDGDLGISFLSSAIYAQRQCILADLTVELKLILLHNSVQPWFYLQPIIT